MNTPENLVATYLRLNGFFVSPHFTVFIDEKVKEIDLLGLRVPGARERAGTYEFPLDQKLFQVLSGYLGGTDPDCVLLGVVTEVKGQGTVSFPDADKVEYARGMTGDAAGPVPLSLSTTDRFDATEEGVHIPLTHCIAWIRERVREMDQEIEGRNKTASWNLSESFLSDLLWLERLEKVD